MESEYQKLYERLVPAVRRTGEERALLGGSLPSICSGCQADADYCVAYLGGENRSKSRFFVLADYCTYVPFGAAGYRFLREQLKEQTVGQFRAQRLKELLGGDWNDLTAEQTEEIVRFLDDDWLGEPDLKTVAGSVGAVCRIYHACEANFGKAEYKDFLDVANRTSDVAEAFLKRRAAGEAVSVQETLDSIPASDELSGKQKKILLKVTNVK